VQARIHLTGDPPPIPALWSHAVAGTPCVFGCTPHAPFGPFPTSRVRFCTRIHHLRPGWWVSARGTRETEVPSEGSQDEKRKEISVPDYVVRDFGPAGDSPEEAEEEASGS
jgi:hypothetical protein